MLRPLTGHPLIAYYLLTFAISWGGFVLAVGPTSLVSANWQAEGKFLPAVLTMLSGPSIAGLLLTGFIEGRSGYRHLWRRFRTWRVGMPSRWCRRQSSAPARSWRCRSHCRSWFLPLAQD